MRSRIREVRVWRIPSGGEGFRVCFSIFLSLSVPSLFEIRYLRENDHIIYCKVWKKKIFFLSVELEWLLVLRSLLFSPVLTKLPYNLIKILEIVDSVRLHRNSISFHDILIQIIEKKKISSLV